MSIAATFQRADRVKKLDPYPMEILKGVDRPTTRVWKLKFKGLMRVKADLTGRCGATGDPSFPKSGVERFKF